ncbi:MAG: metal-dependent transcriptional regulator [Anaerolineae bacterium]|nr:metal-dependent transcriptional regulator [Thermoflexales bacterium]MDW8407814.1 metal-dependent transcriptional regulator [Anaerolineae bacterium]
MVTQASASPDETLNEATLRYLDAIYRLSQHGEPAGNNALAERLNVTPSAASLMLRRLARRGLVEIKPYKGVVLTARGLSIALRTVRRHRLLEVFLVQVMRFPWHHVDRHAQALQTVIDQEFEDRIDQITGHPTRCPHGHIIPTREGVLPPVADVRLLDCPVGTSGVIRCVDTDRDDWLEYLGRLGLVPGAHVTLESIAPFGGPATLRTEREVITLGFQLAEVIWIEQD